MVVDVAVGDGDPLASMSDIYEAVVVILAVVQVTGYIDMVDPDVVGRLDVDGVPVGCKDLGDFQVAYNDVRNALDGQSNTSQAWKTISVRI